MKKRLSILSATVASLAFVCVVGAFADEPTQEALPEAPAAEAAQDAQKEDAPAEQASEQKEGDVEFDENHPEAEEKNADDNSLEAAVETELADVSKNSPEDLLNLATEIKLSASNLLDLTKVVSLCNKAEKLGLDEANMEFAKQLRLSAQLDRGLAVAQLFLDPDLPIAQLPNGWEQLRNSAIGDLTTVLADNPTLGVAHLSLGRLQMLADQNDKAKESFDKAIADEEAEKEVRVIALMFRAIVEDDPHAAIEFVKKAIELEPAEEPRLYEQYADYLQMTERTEEALKQIDKAIELDGENKSFKKAKARLLVKIHRIDEARALFDEATKDEDSVLTAQIEKGQFLTLIKDYDAAIALYTKLLSKFDGPGAYLLRGMVYAEMKEYEKALADANQALRRDSAFLPALRLKGVVYLQQEKYDDAIRAFEQLKLKSKEDSDKINAITQLTYAISKQGRYQKASSMLKEELEKRPDDVELLRALADMELLFGHWSAAKDLYNKLYELAPEDPGVLNNYSWLLSTCPDDQIRDGARALELAKAASEKTSYAAPHILSTLASAYAEQGDFESARSWSQKAVELGEIEKHESLDSLKKELESYKENKPWRETSEMQAEVAEPEK